MLCPSLELLPLVRWGSGGRVGEDVLKLLAVGHPTSAGLR